MKTKDMDPKTINMNNIPDVNTPCVAPATTEDKVNPKGTKVAKTAKETKKVKKAKEVKKTTKAVKSANTKKPVVEKPVFTREDARQEARSKKLKEEIGVLDTKIQKMFDEIYDKNVPTLDKLITLTQFSISETLMCVLTLKKAWEDSRIATKRGAKLNRDACKFQDFIFGPEKKVSNKKCSKKCDKKCKKTCTKKCEKTCAKKCATKCEKK